MEQRKYYIGYQPYYDNCESYEDHYENYENIIFESKEECIKYIKNKGYTKEVTPAHSFTSDVPNPLQEIYTLLDPNDQSEVVQNLIREHYLYEDENSTDPHGRMFIKEVVFIPEKSEEKPEGPEEEFCVNPSPPWRRTPEEIEAMDDPKDVGIRIAQHHDCIDDVDDVTKWLNMWKNLVLNKPPSLEENPKWSVD